MAEVQMLANMRQTYRGTALKTGDKFMASELDAADLTAINYASRVKTPDAAPVVNKPVEPVKAAEPVVATREMSADESESEPDATDSNPNAQKSGRYSRRDLRSSR